MEGTAQTLYWFPNESVKVEVPFFQRPYVWDEEEWDELIASIKSSNDNAMPFIGSFILQKLTDRYYVIDGQQRITTLSVLIKAFLDTFKFTEETKDSRSQFMNFIYTTALHGLKAIYSSRLIPSIVDKNDFDAVMSLDSSPLDNKGAIVRAYHHFVKFFGSCSNEELENFGAKLLTNKKFFIAIVLDAQDDEQKIFDSVNSLGKDLTKADIIKNYLYQRMKEAVNNDPMMVESILKHHDKYWLQTFYSDEKRDFWETKKLMGRVPTNNLEAFLKDFAIIKGFYSSYNTGGVAGLAKAYKEYINPMTYADLTSFSKELSEYANCYYDYYSEYLKMDDFRISDVINTTLLVMDCLETTTFNPYILKTIKENPVDLDSKLFALQRFVFTRFLYKAKTKNYNKVCDVLLTSHNEIDYLNTYDDDSFDINEFPASLKRASSNKQAALILFILELVRRKGQESNYSDSMKFALSLEHIMPQKWEKNWSGVASWQYDEVTNEYIAVTEYNELITNRKKMVCSIGNMTLLTATLNSKLGNASFAEKIKGNVNFSGYEKYAGNLSIAKEIIDVYYEQGKWDERNIHVRSIQIFNELNSYFHFIE